MFEVSLIATVWLMVTGPLHAHRSPAIGLTAAAASLAARKWSASCLVAWPFLDRIRSVRTCRIEQNATSA